MTLAIRPAVEADFDAVWDILRPVIAAGETLALPRDADRARAMAYWRAPGSSVFVAEREGNIVGSYYLRPNQSGGGAHVANAGYVVAATAGGRGVGRAMGLASIERARDAGFAAMQFNFVVASNVRAVTLWQSLGFDIVGRLPRAFVHPALGAVDALVMFLPFDRCGLRDGE